MKTRIRIENPLTHNREEMYDLMNEFFEFLQGNVPQGVTLIDDHKVNLTKGQAFSIIWYLQEHMGVLPDAIEQCNDCGDVYNPDFEGGYVEFSKGEGPTGQVDGTFCDGCYPHWEEEEDDE